MPSIKTNTMPVEKNVDFKAFVIRNKLTSFLKMAEPIPNLMKKTLNKVEQWLTL